MYIDWNFIDAYILPSRRLNSTHRTCCLIIPIWRIPGPEVSMAFPASAFDLPVNDTLLNRKMVEYQVYLL